MIDNSECDFCELNMKDFIDNSLVGVKLWLFLNHVLNCPTCYEELETRYLLDQALNRLENGETIDLRSELGQKISYSRKALRIHRRIDCIARSMQVVAGIIVAFGVYELVVRYIGIG